MSLLNLKNLLEYLLPEEDSSSVSPPNPPPDQDASYRGLHQAPGKRNGAPLWNVTQDIYPDDIYTLPLATSARYYGTGDQSADIAVMSLILAYRNKPNKKIRIYRAVPILGGGASSNAIIKKLEKEIAQLEGYLKQILRRGKISRSGGLGALNLPSSSYDEISSRRDELKAKLDALLRTNKEEGERKKDGRDGEIKDINPKDWVTIYRPYAKEHGESSLRGKYRILSKVVYARELYTDGNSLYEWGWDPSSSAGVGESSESESSSLKEESLEEGALRGFSLDLLKKKTAQLKQKSPWADEVGDELAMLVGKYGLPRMGRGSSRAVYALSTSKVLKISTEDRGRAQTEAEVSVWTNPATRAVAARVFDFDPDYAWSVMEVAKTFKSPWHMYNRSLEKELGFPSGYGVVFELREILKELLSEEFAKNGGETLSEDMLWKLEQEEGILPSETTILKNRIKVYLRNPHPFIRQLLDLISQNELDMGDMVSEHFGKTADGRIVMIDYGLTDEVAREWY